ncbi:protein-tyrosine phosphatase-like protein [Clohesyomyces aquaticus]|uniref:Protein-tyrosine phosphatase-like protein n=1 Tax=Clohesyomyces aquaticus TaxID=1231657 RepID=A0A1Y1Z412_9PLEO|nr:protein-tyrosine phosphatase-like protein [Clohesyomyces aquaticus]
MGWVDLIPRAGGALYIGGLYALYQTDLISKAGITHVLSIIDYDPLLREKFAHLKHFHIRAEDDPNENLLKWFGETNPYIEEALYSTQTVVRTAKRGAVFIHCAMGKSRSATFAIAYLMWKKRIGWKEALEQVNEGRPVCDPNVGFKEQLGVYEKMLNAPGGTSGDEGKRIYDEWVENRFVGDWWEWDKRVAAIKDNEAGIKANL